MPRIVAHFELQALLGHGTLGALHRARDLDVGRTAALRLLAPAIAADEATRCAVLRAAQRVSTIEHPSIAAVYACGDGPDAAFIASEFVPGQRLSAMVQGTPLHPRHALELTAHLADGLAVAQGHGVVHGAISTASVIVTPKGIPKLLDLGLVPWTKAGGLALRDDAAGLGALLFELLVGRPLKPGWPAELRLPQLPAHVQPVLQQLVAPRQGDAFESMTTVAAVLRDLGLVTPRTSAPEPVLLSRDPRRAQALRAGLVVLLLLTALAWAFVSGRLN